MRIIDILAIVLAQCKKIYGEQFEALPDNDKKVVILQFICEIMAKKPFLKTCISETFYNELKENV